MKRHPGGTRRKEETIEDLGAVIGVILLVGLYVLPSVLAVMRHKRNMPMILVVNIFTGWTFLGWCIAFAWSLTSDKE